MSDLSPLPSLPSGTVTFLFTDIEGSTRLWQIAPETMTAAHARHDAILAAAIAAHGGHVFKTIGDAFCAAFPAAPAATAAAVAAQRALDAEAWPTPDPVRARMALHTCQAEPERDGDYRTPGLNRLQRILSAGHGGQVLLSQAAMELARGALPAGVFPWDLGTHRLKDLLEPEHIHQLIIPNLPSDFPPLRSLDAQPNNLPLQPTPFVGRVGEVAEACALLRRPDLRLLTLTGPAGIGKTRLGLQVAAELSDEFADGVFFVPLAPITVPDLILSAIATALGIREAGERPLAELVRDEVGSKQLLLVLDNFEQVSAAAPVVAALLAAGPRSKVLVTSRIPLRVQAEHQLAVPPLPLPARYPLPTAAQLSMYDAVHLFIARAQAVRADFAVTNDNAPAVAEICRRLDGLPLAIELAAARVKLLTPDAMLARLESRLPLLTGGSRDLPTRQRTLRGAIAWSYELLGPDERALFRRLAVFTGGFTWEAAETVAGSGASDESAHDILEGLDLLVDHSLVRQVEQVGSPTGTASEPRFTMLGTIREFGLEQLAASDEADDARQRHAAFFLGLAEAAEPALRGGTDVGTWLDRLETERENLQAALTWSAAHEPATATRLAAELWRFWGRRGPVSEGRAWLERLVAADESGDPVARVRVLAGTATLAMDQGDNDRAETLLTEGLGLARASGDTFGMAVMFYGLGRLAVYEHDFEHGSAFFTEALTLYRQVGDAPGEFFSINYLGELARGRGDLAQASRLYDEALAQARRHGNDYGITVALVNRGMVDVAQGETARARARLVESLSRAIGDLGLTGAALIGLAAVAERQGHAIRAVRLIGAVAAQCERTGLSMEPVDEAVRVQTEAALRRQLDEPTFAAAERAGRALPLDDAVAEALAVAVEVPVDG